MSSFQPDSYMPQHDIASCLGEAVGAFGSRLAHQPISSLPEVSANFATVPANYTPVLSYTDLSYSNQSDNTMSSTDNQSRHFVLDHVSQPLVNYCKGNNGQPQLEERQTNHTNVTATNSHTNYIHFILQQTNEGEWLLTGYDCQKNPANQSLIERKKKSLFSIHKVAKIVIHYEFRRTRSHSILPPRFEELAASVASLFPDYSAQTLYTKRTSESKNAHGVLYTVYSKLKEKASAMGLIKATGSNNKRKEMSEEETSKAFEELQKPVQIIDETYRTMWGRTATEERFHFYKNADAKRIFQTFPNLLHPNGYWLISNDFCSLFNKPASLFSQNWPITALKVVALAKTKTSDRDIQRILQTYSTIINDADVHILALILLPFMFNKILKQSARSKLGRSWYPEKLEVLDTFIYHNKEIGDSSFLDTVQAKVQKFHFDHFLPVQPYVVVNGPVLTTSTCAYVIISNHTLQVPSLTLAVDICFQMVKVFHEKHSLCCNHVWQFLEHEVYKFEGLSLYNGVSKLSDNLN